jgi:hypothetical protein
MYRMCLTCIRRFSEQLRVIDGCHNPLSYPLRTDSTKCSLPSPRLTCQSTLCACIAAESWTVDSCQSSHNYRAGGGSTAKSPQLLSRIAALQDKSL